MKNTIYKIFITILSVVLLISMLYLYSVERLHDLIIDLNFVNVPGASYYQKIYDLNDRFNLDFNLSIANLKEASKLIKTDKTINQINTFQVNLMTGQIKSGKQISSFDDSSIENSIFNKPELWQKLIETKEYDWYETKEDHIYIIRNAEIKMQFAELIKLYVYNFIQELNTPDMNFKNFVFKMPNPQTMNLKFKFSKNDYSLKNINFLLDENLVVNSKVSGKYIDLNRNLKDQKIENAQFKFSNISLDKDYKNVELSRGLINNPLNLLFNH